MKRSLAHGSGYLTIDHRESPGLTPADVAHVPGAVAVGAGQQFEADIQQCTHCQRGVLLNVDRVRPRGYCARCDHFICDSCEAIQARTVDHVPFAKVIDRVDTAHAKGQDIILTDLL